MLCLAVESPKWLFLHGHVLEGRACLEHIRGTVLVDQEIADWHLTSIPAATAEEEGLLSGNDVSDASDAAKAHLGFLDLVKSPIYRPAIIAVVGVMMAQQFCGINSIVMYSVSILSKILPNVASLISVIVSVVNLVATILCMPLPDRLGRKRCLLISIAGMGTSAFLLAISIQYNIGTLSAISTLTFVAAFAVGLGPVPFLLASELVDERAVGTAQSAGLAANWLSTFVVAQFFPVLNEALGGGKVYYVFAGIAVFFIGFLAWRLPETKGKQGMEEVWGIKADEIDE